MIENIADRFREELSAGEVIIWGGQPQQGLMLRPADIFMIPFSLLWGGFSIFLELRIISSGASLFLVAWGIPFVLVGLYILFGRFFVDSAHRAKTYYALTNERAIIISGLFTPNTKRLDLTKLKSPEIALRIKGNGRGTILFGASHPMAWIDAGSGLLNIGQYDVVPSFEMIDDASMVYQHIKRLQNEWGERFQEGTQTSRMKLSQMVDLNLRWVQPRVLKLEYELRLGEMIVATIRYPHLFDTLAVVESIEGSWTLKGGNFQQPSVSIRAAGTETDLAVFKRESRWIGSGVLELSNGQKCRGEVFLSPRFSVCDFTNELGKPLVSYRRIDRFLSMSADMKIRDQAKDLVELPWLVTLGWHLCLGY